MHAMQLLLIISSYYIDAMRQLHLHYLISSSSNLLSLVDTMLCIIFSSYLIFPHVRLLLIFSSSLTLICSAGSFAPHFGGQKKSSCSQENDRKGYQDKEQITLKDGSCEDVLASGRRYVTAISEYIMLEQLFIL